MLWVFDPQWPELIHPFASIVDTPLPKLKEDEEMSCACADSKPEWVQWPETTKAGRRVYGGIEGVESIEELVCFLPFFRFMCLVRITYSLGDSRRFHPISFSARHCG